MIGICSSGLRADPALAHAATSAGAKATAPSQPHECCPSGSPGGWSIRRAEHGCQGESVANRIGSGGFRAHGGTAPGTRPRRSQGQLTRRQRDPLQGRRHRVPRPTGCGCGWARVPGGSGSSLSAVPGTGRSMTSGSSMDAMALLAEVLREHNRADVLRSYGLQPAQKLIYNPHLLSI